MPDHFIVRGATNGIGGFVQFRCERVAFDIFSVSMAERITGGPDAAVNAIANHFSRADMVAMRDRLTKLLGGR